MLLSNLTYDPLLKKVFIYLIYSFYDLYSCLFILCFVTKLDDFVYFFI